MTNRSHGDAGHRRGGKFKGKGVDSCAWRSKLKTVPWKPVFSIYFAMYYLLKSGFQALQYLTPERRQDEHRTTVRNAGGCCSAGAAGCCPGEDMHVVQGSHQKRRSGLPALQTRAKRRRAGWNDSQKPAFPWDGCSGSGSALCGGVCFCVRRY